ncbi:hypothetical protein N9955_00450 [bacterium]|nr:hypothetical protein [bacterium]
MTKKQFKKQFDALYSIQKKLHDGIVVEADIKGKTLQLRITDAYVGYCPMDKEWYFDLDNYTVEAHCDLSKWIDEISDIYWNDYCDVNFPKELKKFAGDDLKSLQKDFDSEIDPEIFDKAFWKGCDMGASKKENLDVSYESYNYILAEHLEYRSKKEKEKQVKEKPEEFISVNGVLLSKKEIKQLAATLQ